MPLGRTLVIINPTARHGVTESLIPIIRSLIDGHLDHTMVCTERPAHAVEIATEAASFDTVVAVGGDGTVHEVLNGIMRIPSADRPALTLLPTGTGNDYRRTLGISTDLTGAVREILSGERIKLDIGVVNGVYFANSIAIGFDARVTARAAEIKMTTGWSGISLYLRALLYMLFRRYSLSRLTLTFDDGQPVDRNILLIAVTNGATYGGGFRITPHALPDDGVFDVCTIGEIDLAGALLRLPFVVTGLHTGMKAVTMGRHTAVKVESPTPIECQLDGEVTLATTYDIRIIPRALDVIAPKGRGA